MNTLIETDEDQGPIGFQDATFMWHDDDDQNSSGVFKLRIEGQVTLEKGSVNLIVGPSGSGKTSLLHALLGEMCFVPTVPGSSSWFNLPRKGGVAYAAQEPWILNATIKVPSCSSVDFDNLI